KWRAGGGCDRFRERFSSHLHVDLLQDDDPASWPPNPSLQPLSLPECPRIQQRHVNVRVQPPFVWFGQRFGNRLGLEGTHSCAHCGLTCTFSWEEQVMPRPDVLLFVRQYGPLKEAEQREMDALTTRPPHERPLLALLDPEAAPEGATVPGRQIFSPWVPMEQQARWDVVVGYHRDSDVQITYVGMNDDEARKDLVSNIKLAVSEDELFSIVLALDNYEYAIGSARPCRCAIVHSTHATVPIHTPPCQGVLLYHARSHCSVQWREAMVKGVLRVVRHHSFSLVDLCTPLSPPTPLPCAMQGVPLYRAGSHCSVWWREAMVKDILHVVRHHSFGHCQFNMHRISELIAHPTCRTPLDKWTARTHCVESRYKFAIAVENSERESYATEKLFIPFDAGTVPVYFGAPDVAHLAPPGSFIDVRAFPNKTEVGALINQLDANATQYLDYHAWRICNSSGNLKHATALSILTLPCRLCLKAALLLADRQAAASLGEASPNSASPPAPSTPPPAASPPPSSPPSIPWLRLLNALPLSLMRPDAHVAAFPLLPHAPPLPHAFMSETPLLPHRQLLPWEVVNGSVVGHGDGAVRRVRGGRMIRDCVHWCLPGVPHTWNQLMYLCRPLAI
ncbi:unnamed protein product, partial [Closterium sp. Yama58-4]